MADLVAYTDGACSKNPGPGAWAYVILYGDQMITRASEFVGEETTNNIAELMAIKSAIQKLHKYCSEGTAKIITDSKYCIGVLSENWAIKANIELVKEIKQLILESDCRFEFIHVPGHSGDRWNDFVDGLARDEISAYYRDDFLKKRQVNA